MHYVTGADGEADLDAIAGATDGLAEIALRLRKAGKREATGAPQDRPSGNASQSRPTAKQTGIRTRAADDFPAIRARLAELRREASAMSRF